MGDTPPPVAIPSQGDLDQIRRRFLALNDKRLALALAELRPQQQDFPRLLPLLFHVNHPLLPGYVSEHTPAGVSGFRMDARQLESARKLARQFQLRNRARREYPIQALFLMGSVGSLGHSRGSDLDIWVCHQSGLSNAELDALGAKAGLLERWATELGLEAHFFLMDAEAFRGGKLPTLSGESSGSTQHGLLLEEFYRSGLLLAGRYPLWWLVPPDQEARYGEFTAELFRQGLAHPGDCLDFGGLADIAAEEFFGAAIWQLYKGVYSPYKAVLKILLTEAYTRDYPAIDWLALQIKRRVHGGETDPESLDAYLLMYRYLESYLGGRHHRERLELARRCLYFKVGESLSRPQPGPGWRTRSVQALVQEWGWSRHHIQDLDARAHWKIDRVTRERSQLVRELTRSYRLLTDFAANHGDSVRVDPKELDLLGRKLYTALEQRPGKVDRVNPGISQDLSETQLALHWQTDLNGKPLWSLFRGPQAPGSAADLSPPIKVSDSLTELLAWCHINGLLGPHTRYALTPPQVPVSSRELRALLQVLRETLPDAKGLETPLEHLASPPFPLSLLGLVNVGSDPLEQLARDGICLVTERTNPFSFGAARRCLLQSLDLVVVTSWGELVVHRHQGAKGLADALCYYLDLIQRRPLQAPAAALRVEGFATPEAGLLAKRVAEAIEAAVAYFTAAPKGRYIMELGESYFLVESGQRGFQWLSFNSEEELILGLGEPRSHYAPPGCDPGTLVDSPLAAIFRACRPGEQQLFYRVGRGHIHLYILDESGSLFHQNLRGEEPRFLLTQYQRFLESLSHLRRQSGMTEEGATLITGSRVYRLEPAGSGGWDAILVRLPRSSGGDDYLELVLLAEGLGQEARLLGLVCGDRSYSFLTLGAQIYSEAVQHILKYRSGAGDYPIYLTSVELAQARYGVPPSGVEILTLKRRVEYRLNETLKALRASANSPPGRDGS